jgi:hypothetical protein
MKTLKFTVVAGLALASSLAARAEISAQTWLECYYLNPQPAELAWQVHRLSDSGYFEQPGHVATAIGFLSTVFARNPERVDDWLRQLNKLPPAHQRLIAAALWQAGQPLGSELLHQLDQNSSVRARIDWLADAGSVPIADTPVLSPSSMNLHWGAFLASGDERYILSILDAIGTNRPGLDTAARTALAKNAAAHPRVQEICEAQLSRQPEEVRSVLRAALSDAASAKPRS